MNQVDPSSSRESAVAPDENHTGRVGPLQEMSLLEHLRELRKRLVYSFIAIAVGACVAYLYSTEIFYLLTSIFYKNFTGGSLIGTGPGEAFMLKLKVAVFAGIILVSPALLYQLWKFIEPALYPPEKKFAIPFIASGTGLFLLGVWFCYTLVLPFSLSFFAEQYQSIGITPQVRISEHLSVMMQALIGFGAVFELPVLAFFLGRLGVITSQQLVASGRYAIVIIFILSAILTPPDALTQLLMAAPLLLLYGISIFIVRLTETTTNRSGHLVSSQSRASESLKPPVNLS